MDYREQLEKLLENSYSPYSHYAVSSIVVMKDGHVFTGVNVENASYGAAVCAEHSCIQNSWHTQCHTGSEKRIAPLPDILSGLPAKTGNKKRVYNKQRVLR